MKKSYHHGDLAESLLGAVDEIATKFGFEAVTLRGCAKLLGVSPSSAFRHYTDKRALLTAFATRALHQLTDSMAAAKIQAEHNQTEAFHAVGLAYIQFALDKPAFFRAMWREEAIYSNNEEYVAAASKLSQHLMAGFADTIADDDPLSLSPRELLAWSSLHGLVNLFVDGPVAKDESKSEKLAKASQMIEVLTPVFKPDNTNTSSNLS